MKTPRDLENRSKRRTVLLLIPHLGGGGAERVCSLLAWGLSPAKYNVHLGVVAAQHAAGEPLPPWVTLHALGARRVRTAGLRLIRLVQQIKPDVILSGAPHLNFLVLALRPLFPRQTRVLVRQSRTASARFRSGHWPDNTRLLYRLLYPRADQVICQTRSMAADLVAHAGLPSKHVRVLPNPIDLAAETRPEAGQSFRWRGPGPHLLAMGRLSHEKGFDLLLDAFAVVRSRHPSADLCILGAGPEESFLRAATELLGLQQCVRFAGHALHPEAWFAGASLFVLPSRTEGLPNALLEAASAGLPLAAIPCSEGVVALLAGEPGAWLARDLSASGLAACILQALARLRQGDRFPHPWIEEFRMGAAVTRYEELIDSFPRRPVP